MKSHEIDISKKLAFRNSIRRGTGRAHLMAIQNDGSDYSREIISACVRNYSYDGQCESSRGSYLYGIIKVHRKEERIKRAVLKALANETRDTWTLTQLFD